MALQTNTLLLLVLTGALLIGVIVVTVELVKTEDAENPNPRIAVVGGGVAGLTAAFREC